MLKFFWDLNCFDSKRYWVFTITVQNWNFFLKEPKRHSYFVTITEMFSRGIKSPTLPPGPLLIFPLPGAREGGKIRDPGNEVVKSRAVHPL